MEPNYDNFVTSSNQGQIHNVRTVQNLGLPINSRLINEPVPFNRYLNN
jgi:hypothetical protein